MTAQMRLGECYRNLKDTIIYNIHYAPDYPEEDRTSLSREFGEIHHCFAALRELLKSDYKLQQLQLAENRIHEAYDAYEGGEDGRQHLEDALTYIEYSKRAAAPPVDYIAGPVGTTRVDQE